MELMDRYKIHLYHWWVTWTTLRITELEQNGMDQEAS